MRVPVYPMSVFWLKKGCLFTGKSQCFKKKIRVLFWPEISDLGLFSDYDNDRMYPPEYRSDPPPPFPGWMGHINAEAYGYLCLDGPFNSLSSVFLNRVVWYRLYLYAIRH